MSTSSLVRAAAVAACVAAIVAVRPAAHAQPRSSGDLLPFKAVERLLPNGLKVIVIPLAFPNIVSLQIPVQTGSRNEVEPGKSGFAHFFEHMMFRGTKQYPPDVYQGIITRAGARQNAYTTDDFTNYHVTFAKDDLESILKIEADRFQNLAYAEEAFKTEARAVLGEYNKNSANPISQLLESQRRSAFTSHTYRHTTMGFLQDIEDMPNQFQYAKTFFDRWYRPEYTTVIVAGDVEAESVVRLVERYWGGWKAGSYKAAIPAEPPPAGPQKSHVDWPTETSPWVSIAFRGPAFSDKEKDWVALDMLADLSFGDTSPLYKRLVQDEQIVDQLFTYFPQNVDPYLVSVFARLKKPEDAVAVRDAILRTAGEARSTPVAAARLADAKANARYGLLRTLDNTEAIAALVARFVRIDRSWSTLNSVYRLLESLTPADLQTAAQRYFVDAGLVQTTLSKAALPTAIATLPPVVSAPAASAPLDAIVQPSALPQLNVRLLFAVGSAHDPAGKEGLSVLAAEMIADAGSRAMPIDDIREAFYPMAASFVAQVDKEMTTFTAVVHRDNWPAFSAVALPMLTDPGFRVEDFTRLKSQQMNALVQDLRANNEEELGKERLQANLFAGTRYAHPVLGTVAGLESITLDDVKDFVKRAYTRAALKVGLSGDLPESLNADLAKQLSKLPDGPALPAPGGVVARAPAGMTVEIVEKDTRATAISFGHPIAVTRKHPDFVALSVARAWLGEHRASSGRLYQQIRELRGMNYGDYAYIEAFPRGMFQFFPDSNRARRAQIFEIWIRPVVPENGHMALRIAVHELRQLIAKGLTPADFEDTRNYLAKNVFLLTASQGQQLGYALDQQWYGLPEYVKYMREGLARLTLDDVNRAIRSHLSGENLHVVVITRDATAFRDRLVSDAPSTVAYDAPKPADVMAEDKTIGSLKLNVKSEAVRITPVDAVFAK